MDQRVSQALSPNPLLQDWDTPYRLPPFDAIRTFVDPSVEFGLRFESQSSDDDEDEEDDDIEVEIDHLDQLDAVLAAGVDTIMLDNFTLADLATGVRRIAGAALVEASGNVKLDTVAAIAATGVDVISSGALTHSVRALDLGLDLSIEDLSIESVS